MKNIKITGRDIIETDGKDNTGAFVELGYAFTPRTGGEMETKVCNAVFKVDLDFVLRHGLLNDEINKKHYKHSDEYKKYYNEGKAAFLAGTDEDNPYDTGTIKDPLYWNTSIMHKRYPWFEGYREAEAATANKKHKLDEFHNEIKAVIRKYGLILEYSDEYGDPYAKTPDGFVTKLC